MRIATFSQARSNCPRSPITPPRHEWYAFPDHLAKEAPIPVAFFCKYCLFVVSQKLFDEVGRQ